jgi:hypothetical protein
VRFLAANFSGWRTDQRSPTRRHYRPCPIVIAADPPQGSARCRHASHSSRNDDGGVPAPVPTILQVARRQIVTVGSAATPSDWDGSMGASRLEGLKNQNGMNGIGTPARGNNCRPLLLRLRGQRARRCCTCSAARQISLLILPPTSSPTRYSAVVTVLNWSSGSGVWRSA